MSGYSGLVMDVEGGVKRYAGKRDRYFKSLLKFADGLPGEKYAYNSPEALREVHTVKGVAGNLGINSLYEAAIACESILKSDAPIELAYEEFRDICARTGTDILALYDDREQDAAGGLPEGNQEEYLMLISKLKSSLSEGDAFVAEAMLSMLKQKSWKNSVDIAKVASLAESYQFDTALELLDRAGV